MLVHQQVPGLEHQIGKLGILLPQQTGAPRDHHAPILDVRRDHEEPVSRIDRENRLPVELRRPQSNRPIIGKPDDLRISDRRHRVCHRAKQSDQPDLALVSIPFDSPVNTGQYARFGGLG